MSARKSSHRTIFLIVSSGSPFALIASSLRSTSKKPVCPMTRSFHPPMAHCGQRVRFAAIWREEFFEVPICLCLIARPVRFVTGALGLQRREEALHRGVVPHIAGSAHRTGDAAVGQQPLELLARVLAA